MKWAGKPKRVKTTFNGRTERGKYIKPFCPEKEERKRNDPNGRGWSPQLNTCGASVLRYPTIAHGRQALRFVVYPAGRNADLYALLSALRSGQII
jgi:hypothetical protein